MKSEQFNKLKEGMKIKNYKQLCELIEEEVKGGNSKILQIKEIERYVCLKKRGIKYTVQEIYETPRPKQRKTSTKYKNFTIPEEHWKSGGVYIIQLENKVYIGSTVVGFRKRFYAHMYKTKALPEVFEILQQGATISVLHLMTDEDEPAIRKIEQEYIDLYTKDSKYAVLNIKETHSYTEPKPKAKPKPKSKTRENKYRHIKINKKDYKRVVELLNENNIKIESK
jgi:hypothetical protein